MQHHVPAPLPLVCPPAPFSFHSLVWCASLLGCAKAIAARTKLQPELTAAADALEEATRRVADQEIAVETSRKEDEAAIAAELDGPIKVVHKTTCSHLLYNSRFTFHNVVRCFLVVSSSLVLLPVRLLVLTHETYLRRGSRPPRRRKQRKRSRRRDCR